MEGQVAVIIGCVQGMGYACTVALLEQGVKTHIGDINVTKGAEIEKELQGKYGKDKISFTKCDITDKDDITRIFRECIYKYGRLDIFSPVAGIFNETKWELSIDINFTSVVRSTYEALKYMSKENGGKGGVVVCFSSRAAIIATVCIPVYSAAKAAVLTFVRSWSDERQLALTGVRFCALLPGRVNTPMALAMGTAEGPCLVPQFMPQTGDTSLWVEPSLVAEVFVRCVKEPELNGKAIKIDKDENGFVIEHVQPPKWI